MVLSIACTSASAASSLPTICVEPRPAANPNPISVAFVDAAREQGYPITDDFNGARFEGAGFHDLLPHADGRIEDTTAGSAAGFDHREARAGLTAQEIGGVQA